MRFYNNSLQRFHSWRAGRIALPLGFLAVLAVGSHLVMTPDDTAATSVIRVNTSAHDGLYHGGYRLGTLDDAGLRNLARPMASPQEIELPVLEKTERRPVPTLVRAIEPSAVYKRPVAPHAPEHPAHRAETAAAQPVAYPAGVERFDECRDACDTRDPRLAPISYPGPATPAPEQAGLFGLPSLSGARDMVGRTVDGAVSGTTAAYDAVKQGVNGVIDGAIELVR